MTGEAGIKSLQQISALKTTGQLQTWDLVYHHCVEKVLKGFLQMLWIIILCLTSTLHQGTNSFLCLYYLL